MLITQYHCLTLSGHLAKVSEQHRTWKALVDEVFGPISTGKKHSQQKAFFPIFSKRTRCRRILIEENRRLKFWLQRAFHTHMVYCLISYHIAKSVWTTTCVLSLYPERSLPAQAIVDCKRCMASTIHKWLLSIDKMHSSQFFISPLLVSWPLNADYIATVLTSLKSRCSGQMGIVSRTEQKCRRCIWVVTWIVWAENGSAVR